MQNGTAAEGDLKEKKKQIIRKVISTQRKPIMNGNNQAQQQMSENKIDNVSRREPYSFDINHIIDNINSLAFSDTLEKYYRRYFGWSWPSYIIFQVLRFLVFRVFFKGLRIWFNSLYRKFKWARRITLLVYKAVNAIFFRKQGKAIPDAR